jgi:hypothetical protein
VRQILRALKGPLATEVAEYSLLLGDLELSIKTIKLWHEKYAENQKSQEETTIACSLFRDGIVQFIGCFDKTAKFALKADDVYKIDGTQLGYFQ